MQFQRLTSFSLIIGILYAFNYSSCAYGVTIDCNDGNYHLINSGTGHEVYRVDYQTPGQFTFVELADGGDIQSLKVYEDGIATVSGGEVLNLHAYGNGSMTVTAGNVILSEFSGNSQAAISGGTFYDCWAMGSSNVTISGATFSYLYSGFYSGDDAVLEIIGEDFTLDGTPINYGQYYTGDFTSGNLVGTLLSGDTLNSDIYIDENACVILSPIPEPATFLLLSLGAMVLRRKHQALR